MVLTEYNNTLNSQFNFTINALNLMINSNEAISISPYSLILALTMCYIGAGGKTEIEFSNLLSSHMEKTKYCNFIKKSIDDIYLSSINNTDIYIANRLFIQNRYKIKDNFKNETKEYLNATFESVNFGNPTVSAKKINDFISNATHQKIKNLINPNNINPSTVAVLTNALYFKSQWKEKFDEDLTTDEDFFITKTEKKRVKMMNKNRKLLYNSNENFHVVKLPYLDNNSAFILVLPKEKNKLQSLLSSIKSNDFYNIINSTTQTNLIFSMPKFIAESSHSWKEPLIKMGLVTAFDDRANFSLISSGNNLKIDNVLQKVYIDVNEEGTEAAAATGIIVAFKSSSIDLDEKIVVRADHPFLYFILHNENILFGGVYQ
ncbi:Serpin domain-containing protein [Strongyloides ratti]|uniref:Serpin domain-containing protein n=1 Tax=Strongyloides ratti TaxID=34506 RepID=A0A090LNZ9_STRRB|nr:Serpin domain-containing protein [Strongyloides ratti]CEF69914.1 Serpin domain-containing protein [Strongyloides ratti]